MTLICFDISFFFRKSFYDQLNPNFYSNATNFALLFMKYNVITKFIMNKMAALLPTLIRRKLEKGLTVVYYIRTEWLIIYEIYNISKIYCLLDRFDLISRSMYSLVQQRPFEWMKILMSNCIVKFLLFNGTRFNHTFFILFFSIIQQSPLTK